MNMKRIAILSNESRMFGGLNILFPLYKWENELKDNNLDFEIYTNHCNKRIYHHEILVINSRYFQKKLNNGLFPDREPIKEFLTKLREFSIKIVFFDAGDSTGSDFFDLMGYVDVYLKKQLLIDKNLYLINNGAISKRIWITKSNDEKNVNYCPCKSEDLHKLKLAWNIGMVDYRYNPLKIGLISNYFFTRLNTSCSQIKRQILTTYRGSIHNNNTYSYQRNTLIKQLSETNLPVIFGKPINRNKYLKELAASKAIVSPFGWGEICYRDFETFINGSILIKPDMSHLETFPNFFQQNVTYLPLNWQMSDLEEKLTMVNENYEDLIEIAHIGQKTFLNLYNDSELFVTHINNIISTIE